MSAGRHAQRLLLLGLVGAAGLGGSGCPAWRNSGSAARARDRTCPDAYGASAGHKTPSKSKGVDAFLLLGGERVEVRWSDGDSFKLRSGPQQGRGTRVRGYNTLETFGPVHRWGSWTPEELLAIAKTGASVAASREWQCTTVGKADGYGRLLVDCPELALHMIREGMALAFAVEGSKPDPAAVAAQKEARTRKAGIWAKGTPRRVLTSLHSLEVDDPPDATAYNRVANSEDGTALKRAHHDRFCTCEEVCDGEGEDQSCMVYVPYRRRYQKRPACLLEQAEPTR